MNRAPFKQNFLIEVPDGQQLFTPESITPQQKKLARIAYDFMENEILPKTAQIEDAEPHLMRSLVEKAGEMGIFKADIVSENEQVDLDLKMNAVISAQLARNFSFFVSYSVQTGIGLLPILYFASNTIQRKYLPGMFQGKIIGSYAVTEKDAGSDAMAIQSYARLSPDGHYYILNGKKQWISNAGFADIHTVLAKIDGTKFTELIVETKWNGVSIDKDEEKMGIHGSSNCSIYFTDVKVPVENVVWEIGKGPKIVYSVINIGRVKLGIGCATISTEALNISIEHTQKRKAFGKHLHHFGLIQKKLAQMATEIYIIESIAFRTMGIISDHLASTKKQEQNQRSLVQSIIEEHTLEASITKVFSSEASNRVIDEGLQIFGGYGYMKGYSIERYYRDIRITRIFEGTNEINRLLIAGAFLKQMYAQQPIFSAKSAIVEETHQERVEEFSEDPDDFTTMVAILERTKSAAIYVIMKAGAKLASELDQNQEFLECVADIAINIYAVDSTLSRALAAIRTNCTHIETHRTIASITTWRYIPQIGAKIDEILHALYDKSELSQETEKVHTFIGRYHINIIKKQRYLANILTSHQKYPLSIID